MAPSVIESQSTISELEGTVAAAVALAEVQAEAQAEVAEAASTVAPNGDESSPLFAQIK